MVAAAPFRGLRFDASVVGDLAAVTAPPYDVISDEARDGYEARSPYNMVRLILARGGPGGAATGSGVDYRPVAELLQRWWDEGALALDPAPAVYLYEERYLVRGQPRVQRGVLASVTLDDGGSWVLPHERTMPGPIEDRLRLLRATRVNLSPVFGLYAGEGRAAAVLEPVTATPAAVDTVDEAGVRHRVWPVTDPRRIAAWSGLLADRHVLIADGHHRYRTSLAYRDEMRRAHPGHASAAWDELLMFLVDVDQHGPSILPIHRLLRGIDADAVLDALAEEFAVRRLAGPDEAEEALAAVPGGAPAFGLHGHGGTSVLVARDPEGLAAELGLHHDPLDVEVLHGPVLGKRLGVTDPDGTIVYDNDLARALRRVDEGEFASLLILRPVRFETVVEIAGGGGTFPPKTTFFYPKPRDGLVLRPLEPEAPL
jgi:uncharacterized protein (DUF1015 family)